MASTPVSVDQLRELPLFAELSDSQLQALTPLVQTQQVAANANLLEQGEAAHTLYIIVRGKFRLTLGLGQNHRRCLLTLAPPEIIGWSALLAQPTWLASATALRESTVLVVDGPELRAFCEADTGVGYHIMRNLFDAVAARLHDTRLQLLDMYGRD